VKQHSEENGQQLSDIATLRQRALQDMEEGAVTGSYAADRDTVLRVLNEALATEIVCTLRYRRHYFMADGPRSSKRDLYVRAHWQSLVPAACPNVEPRRYFCRRRADSCALWRIATLLPWNTRAV
jgi:hypothetical protein